MSQDKKLFVHGVDEDCPRKVLESEFGRCGEVTNVYNTGKGYAFVTMKEESAAQVGVNVNFVSAAHGCQILQRSVAEP